MNLTNEQRARYRSNEIAALAVVANARRRYVGYKSNPLYNGTPYAKEAMETAKAYVKTAAYWRNLRHG